jgi:hypothetical protein
MKTYYAIDYAPDDAGCPHYLIGNYTPEEWEFETDEPNPLNLTINERYKLELTDRDVKSLNFDYYGNEPKLVSKKFLELCDELGVKFRAIEIDVKLATKGRPTYIYYIFLPGDSISLLNTEDSEFTVERIVETGEPMTNNRHPSTPIYSRIDRFSVKDIKTPPLFFCVEILQLVCTDEFRARALHLQLNGMSWVPIDESYVYDLWASD